MVKEKKMEEWISVVCVLCVSELWKFSSLCCWLFADMVSVEREEG